MVRHLAVEKSKVITYKNPKRNWVLKAIKSVNFRHCLCFLFCIFDVFFFPPHASPAPGRPVSMWPLQSEHWLTALVCRISMVKYHNKRTQFHKLSTSRRSTSGTASDKTFVPNQTRRSIHYGYPLGNKGAAHSTSTSWTQEDQINRWI